MVDLKTVAINTTILLIFLNAGPALLVSSGVAADMGIDPSVSGDEPINQANEGMSNIEASGGSLDTLFTLYQSVTSPVRTVTDVVFAGPSMLISAGLPDWVVGFVFAPMYLITGGAIIYVLAGRLL
jgi:hypothetical protein